jgi:hypothetical protein
MASNEERQATDPQRSLRQQRALLIILLGTCDRALEAFQAADNPIDVELLEDLERMIARTRSEIEVLSQRIDSMA